MQPPCCYFTLYKELLFQSFVFSENLYPYVIVYDPFASGASVDSALQVRSSAMLVLLVVGN
jgi:hypothetical protein